MEWLHRNARLCEDHFELTQVMNTKKERLIWNAGIPTTSCFRDVYITMCILSHTSIGAVYY